MPSIRRTASIIYWGVSFSPMNMVREYTWSTYRKNVEEFALRRPERRFYIVDLRSGDAVVDTRTDRDKRWMSRRSLKTDYPLRAKALSYNRAVRKRKELAMKKGKLRYAMKKVLNKIERHGQTVAKQADKLRKISIDISSTYQAYSSRPPAMLCHSKLKKGMTNEKQRELLKRPSKPENHRAR